MNEDVTESNARSLGAVQKWFNIVAPVENAANIRQPTSNGENAREPPDDTTPYGARDGCGQNRTHSKSKDQADYWSYCDSRVHLRFSAERLM